MNAMQIHIVVDSQGSSLCCTGVNYVHVCMYMGSPGSPAGKNLPSVQETSVQFLGQQDPLEVGMATHFRILCLENPHGQRSLEGLKSTGLQRVRHD